MNKKTKGKYVNKANLITPEIMVLYEIFSMERDKGQFFYLVLYGSNFPERFEVNGTYCVLNPLPMLSQTPYMLKYWTIWLVILDLTQGRIQTKNDSGQLLEAPKEISPKMIKRVFFIYIYIYKFLN